MKGLSLCAGRHRGPHQGLPTLARQGLCKALQSLLEPLVCPRESCTFGHFVGYSYATTVQEREAAAAAAASELHEGRERLKRDRRVLEKQSRALLKLPNKKERSEVERLQAEVQVSA